MVDDGKIPISFLELRIKLPRNTEVSQKVTLIIIIFGCFLSHTFFVQKHLQVTPLWIAVQKGTQWVRPQQVTVPVPHVLALVGKSLLFLFAYKILGMEQSWSPFWSTTRTRSDNSKHTLMQIHLVKSHCSQMSPELKIWFICCSLHFSTSWKHQFPASKRMKSKCFITNTHEREMLFFFFFCLRLKHNLKEYLIKRVPF